MKMKRTVSFLLVLAMVAGLCAGCGTQGGETQPGMEITSPPETTEAATEPSALVIDGPPRTAEEFLFCLDAELKARNIQLEFVYNGENTDYEGGYWAHYLAAFTDSGSPVVTEEFDLALYYPNEPSDPMTKLQIWVSGNADQREREMYQTVSVIAAVLTDPYMTAEKATKMFSMKQADTEFITYNGDIGSFADIMVNKAIVFCQPMDLTHSIHRAAHHHNDEWYEITFTTAGEKLFADREQEYLTIQELEDGLNAWFEGEGMPIACVFQMTGRRDSYSRYSDGTRVEENHGYVLWTSYFYFTTYDDPDFAYPPSDPGPYLEDNEATRRAQMDRMFICMPFVVEAKGFTTDAPVYGISQLEWSFDDDDLAYLLAPQLVLQISQVVTELYEAETGEEISDAYAAACARVMGGEDHVQIDVSDRTTIYVDVYGDYSIDDHAPSRIDLNVVGPQNLLDSELLEYKYTTSEPIVQDGLFHKKQDSTDIFHVDMYDYINLDDLLSDYILSTGAPIWLEHGYSDGILIRIGNSIDYFDFGYFEYNRGAVGKEVLDRRYFGAFITDPFDIYGADIYAIYYNESVPCPIDIEYIIRAAVGYAQMLDEGMTAEEAVQLLSTPQEVVMTNGAWEISVYCPREVAHILYKNVETGMNVYFALTKSTLEDLCGGLEGFALDIDPLGEYEYLLEEGYLDP